MKNLLMSAAMGAALLVSGTATAQEKVMISDPSWNGARADATARRRRARGGARVRHSDPGSRAESRGAMRRAARRLRQAASATGGFVGDGSTRRRCGAQG